MTEIPTRLNAIHIVFVLAGIVGLLLAIVAAGKALETRAARKRASSLLGRACSFCGNSFRQDTILTARLENGFEDGAVTVICASCSKSVTGA